MVYLMVGYGWTNIDTFRHGIERTPPVDYLTLGYYGRWRASLERILVERGVLAAGEVDARSQRAAERAAGDTTVPPGETEYGFERAVGRAPRFAVGDRVRARVASPAGTRACPTTSRAGRASSPHVRAA